MRIFYQDQIKVKRMKGSGNVKSLVATATADCSLQPLGRDRGNIEVGVFGSSYIAYMDSDVPIEVGDMVTDRNGTKYSVTDVVVRDYGAFPYKEVILKRS